MLLAVVKTLRNSMTTNLAEPICILVERKKKKKNYSVVKYAKVSWPQSCLSRAQCTNLDRPLLGGPKILEPDILLT